MRGPQEKEKKRRSAIADFQPACWYSIVWNVAISLFLFHHVQIYDIISTVCFLLFQHVRWTFLSAFLFSGKHPVYTLKSPVFALASLSDIRLFLVRQRWVFIYLFIFTSSIYIHVFPSASPPSFWTGASDRDCGCVSYQIFSPVIHIYVQHRLSPLQLLSSRGMTQFLFIIIMHSLPAWIDYTQATPCVPNLIFLPGGM